MDEIHSEPRTSRPSATGGIAGDIAKSTINEGVEDLVTVGHCTSVHVSQHGREVLRVGVDAFPYQNVWTSSGPTLTATRRDDLVGKSRRNAQEDSGDEAHDGERPA